MTGFEEEAIVLEGKMAEMCIIKELRNNFTALMTLLTISSFSLYLINFNMNQVKGSLISNTIFSYCAELFANLLSGVIYFYIGARWGFFS